MFFFFFFSNSWGRRCKWGVVSRALIISLFTQHLISSVSFPSSYPLGPELAQRTRFFCELGLRKEDEIRSFSGLRSYRACGEEEGGGFLGEKSEQASKHSKRRHGKGAGEGFWAHMELGISPLPGGGGQGAEEVRCVVLLLLSETLASLAGRFNGDYEDKWRQRWWWCGTSLFVGRSFWLGNFSFRMMDFRRYWRFYFLLFTVIFCFGSVVFVIWFEKE